ncbi:potassium channel family protein [Sneathiella marina]|uniref:Potassium channel family protein n=1 Tax=Sneathiella marina TaxID=2950108 RepID=A0ABY4W8G6_9PROT|nr:potassium channel family protein [Sneathiella marina]USG63074.1 potassium channel family protein [Sneathiella marina]
MFLQLTVGTGLIIACVVIHAVCLELLMRRLKIVGPKWDRRLPTYGHIIIMIIVVLGLFGAHTIEAWVWAIFYWVTGDVSNFANGIYFSTVTYTTLGYGDITLSPDWQITSSLQAVSGIILFGWSTAFLVNVRTFFWKKWGIDQYKN